MKYLKKINEYNHFKAEDKNLLKIPLIKIRNNWFSIEEICDKYPENDYEIEIFNRTQDYLDQFHYDMKKAINILSQYDTPLTNVYECIKKHPQPVEKIDYSENENIYLNLSNTNFVELCPIIELDKFREFNRNEEWSLKNKAIIKKDIIENGIKEPMIIEYSIPDRKALLIEGNHRLDIAHDLNLKYYPVKVLTKNYSFKDKQAVSATIVSGIDKDENGHINVALKPSQIGIKNTKPIEYGLY